MECCVRFGVWLGLGPADCPLCCMSNTQFAALRCGAHIKGKHWCQQHKGHLHKQRSRMVKNKRSTSKTQGAKSQGGPGLPKERRRRGEGRPKVDKPTVEGEPKEESKRSKREKERTAEAARPARASLHPAATDQGVPKAEGTTRRGPQDQAPAQKREGTGGAVAPDRKGPSARRRESAFKAAACRDRQGCECASPAYSGWPR